jgi:hypothetical protein
MEEKKTPQQKYYEANKEKIAAQRKARYEANKELFKEKRENNKEFQREYYQNNKEKLNEYHKKRYEENKTTYLENRKKYREDNKTSIKEYKTKYKKTKMDVDTLFKLKHNISSLIRQSIKRRGHKKLTKTEIILGCTFDEFKQHIESLWEPWMNWDNYGNPKDGIFEPNKTWDYDHIQPMKEGMTEMEVIKLNHYSNIQPMCSYHNRFIKN